MDERIAQLRARIAELDRALLAAAGERLLLVGELRGEKAARGLDFVDPEQERRLTERLVAANDGPFTDEGVRELVAAILALTKRELDRGKP
jgi:3-deoxy-7-phosphoheptulonate synthase/chorismate mutase